MHSQQVFAEDSFTDGKLDVDSDSAPGGRAPAASVLHGQDTLTYVYYEPQVATRLGWKTTQTGHVAATVPPPPTRDGSNAPVGGRVAAAGPEDDEGGVGDVEIVDDDAIDDPEEDNGEAKETKEARLRKEAVSRKHLLTHLPKNPYCRVCTWAKTLRAQQRSKKNKSYK